VRRKEINKVKKDRRLERKEKWRRVKNRGKSETFVISHFFLGTLDTSFAV
jgi:hypothetical protein